MADALAGLGRGTAANGKPWTRVYAGYTGEHAFQAWAAGDIVGGPLNVPEAELGVLGDVSGLDVAGLGSGTAYLQAWLARRAARLAGVDLTPAQLDTARRRPDRFGICFPLVQANAGDIPLPGASFDLAVSGSGANSWCDPHWQVPEAARLLRSGGRLASGTGSVPAAMCTAGSPGCAGREPLYPQRGMTGTCSSGHGVQFHSSHGQWIRVLGAAGFTVARLHELHTPTGTQTYPYYDLAAAQRAGKWPLGQLRAAHLPAPGAPHGG